MARFIRFLAVCLLAMLAIELVAAQSCPSPLDFADCLPYARAGTAKPDAKCCNLVKSSRWTNACLCNLARMNFPGVDFKTAIGLPKACGRKVPKGTKCGGVTVPL